MSLDTYNNLKTSIAGWLRRDGLTSVIPDFIVMGEELIKKRLRVYQMIQTTTVSLAASATTATLPTGFIKARSLSYNDVSQGRVLEYMPIAELQSLYSAYPTDIPKAYSYRNGQLVLAPATPTAINLTLEYLGMPSALSNSVQTNSILTAYPTIYLNAALFYGFGYVRHAERQANIAQVLKVAIDDANKASRELMKSGQQQVYRSSRRNRRIP